MMDCCLNYLHCLAALRRFDYYYNILCSIGSLRLHVTHSNSLWQCQTKICPQRGIIWTEGWVCFQASFHQLCMCVRTTKNTYYLSPVLMLNSKPRACKTLTISLASRLSHAIDMQNAPIISTICMTLLGGRLELRARNRRTHRQNAVWRNNVVSIRENNLWNITVLSLHAAEWMLLISLSIQTAAEVFHAPIRISSTHRGSLESPTFMPYPSQPWTTTSSSSDIGMGERTVKKKWSLDQQPS